MYYNPYYYYDNIATAMGIGVIVAIILACVVYFTFMKKSNEGKFTGVKGLIYNYLTFNKFYLEDVVKFLHVLCAALITVVGLVMLFVNFITGIVLVIVGNVSLRISYELLMMFIILCKKSAAIDKKLEKIEKFYVDDFDEPCEEDVCEAEEFDVEFFEGCEEGICAGCPSAEECEKKPEEVVVEAEEPEVEKE